MRFIAPGEMFGTLALFTNRRYPADAVCLVDTLEASWSEAELFMLIHRHPAIAINIARIVGKRLQEMQNGYARFPLNGCNSGSLTPCSGLPARQAAKARTAWLFHFRCGARTLRIFRGPPFMPRVASSPLGKGRGF